MLLYSWNINGFKTCDKYDGYSKILNETPDFFCLQEVKVHDPNLLNNLFTLEYQHYYNFSEEKGRNGVYILAKRPANKCFFSIGLNPFDYEGRFICLEYDEFYLINIYMPHGGRKKELLEYKLLSYQKLYEFIKSLHGKQIIISGDFNIAYSNLDVERFKNNFNNIMFTEEEKKQLHKLFDIGLIDTYRTFNSCNRKYTWWPYAFEARKRNVGWRIDYILVSKDMKNMICETYVRNDIYGSDHCPIGVKIHMKDVI